MNKIKTSVLGLVVAVLVAAPLLAFLATFMDPALSQVSALDTVPDCVYNFSPDGTKILRTNCSQGVQGISTYNVGSATFKSTTAPDGNSLRFVHTDSSNCSQNILINDKNDRSSGLLTGGYTVPGLGCVSFVQAAITIGNTDSGINSSSSNDVMAGYLTDLINKACAAEIKVGGAVGQNCTSQYQDWITTCTQNALNAVDPSSKTVNQDFKDKFSACLSQKSGGKLTKAQIASALPADAYQQAVAADERGGATGNDSSVSCESSAGPLGWILCALIDGLQKGIGGIYDHVVQPLLRTQPLDKNSAQGQGIYKAWSNFRIYGDVFLVIALLIIVFGESIGGGVIDAYTAKKVLPRLLAAAILINLSFYICAVLVDIINVVGNGISTLITAPFSLTGNFKIDIGGGGATTLTALLGVAVTKSLLVAGADGFFAWLWAVVLLPAILIFVAIMVVVLLRSALIVFLVIISPVAFALYCLPNTEKYFRQWWDTLFRTLLVYPIIAVLFALGNVGGYLISQVSGSGLITGGIGAMLAVVALIIPLILIPFSFRVAGGILGRMHDAVSGLRTRAHSMNEERRQNVKTRLGRSKQARKAWALNQAINKNPVGQGVQRVPFLGKHVGGLATGAQQKLSIMQAELMRDVRNGPLANDNWAHKAWMQGSYAAAVRNLPAEMMADDPSLTLEQAKQKALDAAMRVQGSGIGWSQSSAMTAFQMGVQDGTTFKDNQEQTAYINRLAGNDAVLRERLVGNAYAGNKGAGRYDLSASYGSMKVLADAVANGGVFEEGAKFMGESRGGTRVTDLDWQMATTEGMRSTSNTELGRIKGMGMKNGAGAMRAVLSSPQVGDTVKAEIIAKLENLRDSGLYMPEAVAAILNDQALTQPITAAVSADVHAAATGERRVNLRAADLRRQARDAAREAADAVRLATQFPDNDEFADLARRARAAADQAARAAERAEIAAADSAARGYDANGDQIPPTPGQAYNEQRQRGHIDPHAPGGPLDHGGDSSPTPPGIPE